MLKPNEPHTFGFPSCSPDLTITSGENMSKSKKWRDRDAFGEVKLSIKQGPKPTIAGMIPNIVTQSADYACLFMSARPFLLFCVGIMIFGTKFCVGIFDRDGITFSPIYDMFEDTETLIRLVRSLLCNLCMEKLGSDPTVHTLDPSETQRLAGQHSRGFPSAVVSSVGNDHHLWCTIGPPIWTSMSFLGRGTNTWLIREYKEGTSRKSSSLHGNDMIMKTAWRSSARKPESDIYNLIPHPPEGLAKFECGGDVKFAHCHIMVQNLRSDMVNTSLPEDNHEPTPILHCLVLRTVGRPMWEYTSDLDLLLGFRDALCGESSLVTYFMIKSDVLSAHEDLCNQGILHRDISAGNILLAMNQDGPLRGFITDLEFACIDITKPQVITITTVSPQDKFNNHGHAVSKTEPMTHMHITFESKVEVERGAPMTVCYIIATPIFWANHFLQGTAQFMASELLEQEPTGSVEHQVKHDMESFIWVLSYFVMRNIFDRASKSSMQEVRSQCSNFRKIIRQAFGFTTKVDIAAARQSRSAILVFPKRLVINQIVSNFMTPGLINLFHSFETIVHHAHDPQSPTAITHSALLKVVDKAITLLS